MSAPILPADGSRTVLDNNPVDARRCARGKPRRTIPPVALEPVTVVALAAMMIVAEEDRLLATMGDKLIDNKPREAITAPPLKAGDKVHHEYFGIGVVVNCTSLRGDYEVTVAFPGKQGIKRLLLGSAPMTKVQEA